MRYDDFCLFIAQIRVAHQLLECGVIDTQLSGFVGLVKHKPTCNARWQILNFANLAGAHKAAQTFAVVHNLACIIRANARYVFQGRCVGSVGGQSYAFGQFLSLWSRLVFIVALPLSTFIYLALVSFGYAYIRAQLFKLRF